MRIFALMIASLSVFSASANAKEGRVYIISDDHSPVRVKKKVGEEKGIVMRDPNIGVSTKNEKNASKPVTHKKLTVEKKQKNSSLSFKSIKIDGTIRLPRVEFGRVSLSRGIRDESVSDDFTQRSIDRLP